MAVQTQPTIERPETGDIAPHLALKRRTGATFDPASDDEAGRFQVLVFAPAPDRPAAAALALAPNGHVLACIDPDALDGAVDSPLTLVRPVVAGRPPCRRSIRRS